MVDFRLIHIDHNTAQSINRVRKPCKSYRNEIRDIHIQIHVQHIDRHFRPALHICRITFVVSIVAQVQISVTVYGNKLAFTRVQVN